MVELIFKEASTPHSGILTAETRKCEACLGT
uniref:Uncharacterized protein n=1 Tax=Arundo donax TaxID=35708 RepID=A0A0A9GDB8_ARUDO